ncbi:MAG TPA: hypothetical protein VN915_11835 [Elusimicrobiota bacterium]|nr:hypothetical protein [Elusimicrobiota bacterium]
MNCPSCGLNAGEAVECPACGVIFAKWKPRQEIPSAKTDRSLSAGTIAAVLVLTLGGVWFYARKTIVFPAAEPASTEPAPVTLYLGSAVKAPGEIQIPLAPLAKFDGFTKAQIYDIRRHAIAEHPELTGKSYEPSDYVFGSIEDGKPWWGLEGLYFYGDGPNGNAGPSEESRFLPNPFLLVGIRESMARTGATPDGSTNYYPYPTRLAWNAAESSARVEYSVSQYFDFTANHAYSPEYRRQFQFVLYNARDLGFRYFALDRARSKGISLIQDTDEPRSARQFIHRGPSCGVAGGCNNMSPHAKEFLFDVPAAPAKAVLKLWRTKPDDSNAPADMTYTIDMI